jgi:hypothetical protein
MSLSRALKTAACLALLVAVTNACGEDGKTAPEQCHDSRPIFDIQGGEANLDNPCVTKPGFAISGVTTTPGGTSSGGSASAAAGGS